MELGWICPKCNNTYAPNTPFCLYCWFKNTDLSENKKDENTIINTSKVKYQNDTIKVENKKEKSSEAIEAKNTVSNILTNKNLELGKIEIEIPKLNKEAIFSASKKWPDTKIFLSGIGHAKERAIKRKFIIPYILDSIIDFPLQPSKLVKQYFDYIAENKIEYLMDSGAFTYLANSKKSFDLKTHLKKYCYYINEFDIKNFFELDLDSFMTIEEIENIRKKIYLETNKKPLIVYHPERGHDYWINMCKENDYIAIGGLVTGNSVNNDKRYNELRILCEEAHKYNTKVHGLGFTPLTLLNSHTMFFDSVDSTSWNCSKNGYSAMIDEKGKLIKTTLEYYFSSIEAQEKDLETWANFSKMYKGANREVIL